MAGPGFASVLNREAPVCDFALYKVAGAVELSAHAALSFAAWFY